MLQLVANVLIAFQWFTMARGKSVRHGSDKMKQRVYVWNEPVEIEVYQKSKTVWIAVGDYLGKRHEVKDRTPIAAANLWAETAKYHSN